MELVLFPRKEFEFKLESGVIIEGKFGTWAANRLSVKKGWNLTAFMNFFSDTERLSLDDIVQLLLCTVEYKWRKNSKGPFPYNDIDACEWIEELGGALGDNVKKLFDHFASDIEAPAEKKNQEETVN